MTDNRKGDPGYGEFIVNEFLMAEVFTSLTNVEVLHRRHSVSKESPRDAHEASQTQKHDHLACPSLMSQTVRSLASVVISSHAFSRL